MLNMNNFIKSLREYQPQSDSKRKREYKQTMEIISSYKNLSEIDYTSLTLDDIHMLKDTYKKDISNRDFCRDVKNSLRKMKRYMVEVDFI